MTVPPAILALGLAVTAEIDDDLSQEFSAGVFMMTGFTAGLATAIRHPEWAAAIRPLLQSDLEDAMADRVVRDVPLEMAS